MLYSLSNKIKINKHMKQKSNKNEFIVCAKAYIQYLDRQDSYTLLFFVKSLTTGIPQICPRMKVNGWNIRLNDSELES
ncbi:FimB/Mfa2 family fimbrial subunit [Bacteroides acidifaciens]|uniref:FimB/Mfa2 family fimbrial subunit n=1 Tax=Bacteroides acidifaciens TaxID=85831 RepID=UPI00280B3C0F|nr:FimB/Mfa2 family fimbrial subunit [Bacteroides acidifaciens]